MMRLTQGSPSKKKDPEIKDNSDGGRTLCEPRGHGAKMGYYKVGTVLGDDFD
jgi:hypothetical protein